MIGLYCVYCMEEREDTKHCKCGIDFCNRDDCVLHHGIECQFQLSYSDLP